jgi:hypothetical protein
VADDHRLRRAERVKHADHVADEMKQRVLIDGFRLAGLAIAAHIGRHRAITGTSERLQLMAPRIPGFRKAVAEEHDGSASRFGEMDRDPVCLDGAMGDLGHAPSPSIWLDLHAFDDTSNLRTPVASGRAAPSRPPSPQSTPSIRIGFPVV